MRYAIVANPRAGGMLRPAGPARLRAAAGVLGAAIHGLETASPSEFADCARRVSGECDVLVAAGGDTTVSLVVNSVDPAGLSLAYLPMGTGNALGHAFGYGGDPVRAARAIAGGSDRKLDLLNCPGGVKAFIASLGLDATAVRLRHAGLARGGSGLASYAGSFLRALFRAGRTSARLFMDDAPVWSGRLLTLLAVKHPYYGLGMKVVPGARPDDGRIHALVISSASAALFLGIPSAFLGGNIVGRGFQGKSLTLETAAPVDLQADGGPSGRVLNAAFSVLPGAVRFRF